jgi:D-alanyl-lipoteichoic acid acyltransferase DltB (MBOAT superfamily)
MAITSFAFAALVLGALGVYYLLPLRWQNLWLLGVSYVFVFTWAWPFALVLAASTLANFWLAHRLKAAAGGRARLLWLGIGLNLVVLLHFKSAAFYVPQLQAWAVRQGMAASSPVFSLAVPLGLSYYALQAIAYLVDVSKGLQAPAASLAQFALYMAYFPKLVAGPIERARTFLPRLAAPRVVDNALLARSLALIVVGLVRKLALADPLAAWVPAAAFTQPAAYGALELAAFLLAYGLALYQDFAGYTNIVRGISGLFGIELSRNFNYPYFARTFSEFWTRWHISLSEWLRDYIYFPVSRALVRFVPNREHVVHRVLPNLVTMAASAIWHASVLNVAVLVWGLLHAGYLILERLPRLRPVLAAPNQWPAWKQWLGTGIVFSLTTLAWVPFHPGIGLAEVLRYWGGLLNWGQLALPEARLLVLVVLAVGFDWLLARSQDETVFVRWPLPARSLALAGAILVCFLMARPGGSAPFVYQGF